MAGFDEACDDGNTAPGDGCSPTWGFALVNRANEHLDLAAPTRVQGATGVTAIAVGSRHVCMVMGGIRCAGQNDQGQLGLGIRTPPTRVATEIRLGGPPPLRPFERSPDCAKNAGCRPQCGSCAADRLCASDGTCKPVKRVAQERKGKNYTVSWERWQWGDAAAEKALGRMADERARDSISHATGNVSLSAECRLTYISERMANLWCFESADGGGAHPLHGADSDVLDLRAAEPSNIKYEDVARPADCQNGIETFAIDQLLAQDAEFVVEGSVTDPTHEFSISREGLELSYSLYSVQTYMAGEARVTVPCTVLRALGCQSPVVDDICR